MRGNCGAASIRRGEEALRRYVTAPPASQDAEYAAATADLTGALRSLPPGDPARADVSFLLGALRLAAHEQRCAEPCQAPAEFPPIVELIAAGGARDGAPARQLLLYAIAADKVYDHTRDPADIAVAIDWLRRAAADQRLPAADRRRMLINLAVQHANRAEAARPGDGRPGPGSECLAALDAAIGQFEEVLAMTARRAGWRDESRATDRLDALLGQLETYYKRGDGAGRTEDLDVMAGLARDLITGMVPGYHVRAYALGRAGVALLERLTKVPGDSWDRALNAAVSSLRPDAIGAAASGVPGFRPDLELAIGALTEAVRLTDPADARQPAFTAALCTAHGLRYLAFARDDDLVEVGRRCRAVLGHPHASDLYRRQCGEWLLAVLARRAAGADGGAGGPSRTGWPLPSPSAQGDLDTMLGVLAAFAADDEATLGSALSALLTDSVLTRSEGNLSGPELAAEYDRARSAAAGLAGVPAAHAVLQLRAAEIGAQLVLGGGAPAGTAREVAPPGPAGEPSLPVTADELPPVLDALGIRALAALGVGTQGWLAATAGSTADAAAALLARRPRDAAARAAVLSVLALAEYETWVRERAGDGLGGSLGHVRAAVSALPGPHPLRARLTLVLARMLLDRAQTGGDLADADAALSLLDGLRARAAGLPAPAELGVLLAEAGPPQLGQLLAAPPAGLAGQAGAGGYDLDLDAAEGAGLLLRGILAAGGPTVLAVGGPAAPPADGAGDGRAGEDLSSAAGLLRGVARSMPAADPRRPDVLSDLGLALLAAGTGAAGPAAAGTAPGDGALESAEVLHEAAAAVIAAPGHPRRTAILLRAAAALAAAERAAARAAALEDDPGRRPAGGPDVIDEGISLLTRALSVAGLTVSGDRARCLYGLGGILLIRFARARQPADLARAIACLEEARAGVEAVPGDPFLVPLLRALAWAHRQNGYRLAREPGQQADRAPTRADAPRLPLHQARSTARSVLYAHAQSVLLQSGSRNALAASRAIGPDALTLAAWCVADGRADSAVEALELGRALVLHAATVAADVPALLREAGSPGLAAEWAAEASAVRAADGIDAIPPDLRGRALAALRTGVADRRLLAAPSVADIARTLRSARLDALAYLIPASAAARGRVLIVEADGTARECPLPGLAAGPGTVVARFASADREFRATRTPLADAVLDDVAAARRFTAELDGICDWAWQAAIGPLLGQLRPSGPDQARPDQVNREPEPLRVALVPIGILGLIPWHAARRAGPGTPRYACADAIFTTCASARQLMEAVGRPRLMPGSGLAVFVADPTGDLPGARREADAIRTALYPGAVYLGRSDRAPASGAGTPDEVLARLPGGSAPVRPAVLHLGCHATAGASPEDSRLVLAGGETLPVSRILAQARHRDGDAASGLVVLAACTSDLALADHDEALTLASAFLAAGAGGAVGARWAVPDRQTAPLMFMFHRYLVRDPGDGPAAALRAAQLWMLDPDKAIPPEMPAGLADLSRAAAARRPYAWAAFTCHGQ